MANATKWLLQFRRLTKPSTGVNSKLMPKITYGLDIWYTPPSKPAGHTRNTGSVGVLHNLQKIQQIATLAITGTLRTSLNDYIETHSRILPTELALLKAFHSATIHSLTLPNTNPIHQIIQEAKQNQPTRYPGPIDHLLKIFSLRNKKIETIWPSITLNRES